MDHRLEELRMQLLEELKETFGQYTPEDQLDAPRATFRTSDKDIAQYMGFSKSHLFRLLKNNSLPESNPPKEEAYSNAIKKARGLNDFRKMILEQQNKFPSLNKRSLSTRQLLLTVGLSLLIGFVTSYLLFTPQKENPTYGSIATIGQLQAIYQYFGNQNLNELGKQAVDLNKNYTSEMIAEGRDSMSLQEKTDALLNIMNFTRKILHETRISSGNINFFVDGKRNIQDFANVILPLDSIFLAEPKDMVLYNINDKDNIPKRIQESPYDMALIQLKEYIFKKNISKEDLIFGMQTAGQAARSKFDKGLEILFNCYREHGEKCFIYQQFNCYKQAVLADTPRLSCFE